MSNIRSEFKATYREARKARTTADGEFFRGPGFDIYVGAYCLIISRPAYYADRPGVRAASMCSNRGFSHGYRRDNVGRARNVGKVRLP